MTIGDKVKCISPLFQGLLWERETHIVTAITENEGQYFVLLEGYGDFTFPEDAFEILPVEETVLVAKTPEQEVKDSLQEWRDKLVDAENQNNEHEKEQCWKYIDFFLDKLLTIRKYDAQAAVEAIA